MARVAQHPNPQALEVGAPGIHPGVVLVVARAKDRPESGGEAAERGHVLRESLHGAIDEVAREHDQVRRERGDPGEQVFGELPADGRADVNVAQLHDAQAVEGLGQAVEHHPDLAQLGLGERRPHARGRDAGAAGRRGCRSEPGQGDAPLGVARGLGAGVRAAPGGAQARPDASQDPQRLAQQGDRQQDRQQAQPAEDRPGQHHADRRRQKPEPDHTRHLKGRRADPEVAADAAPAVRRIEIPHETQIQIAMHQHHHGGDDRDEDDHLKGTAHGS